MAEDMRNYAVGDHIRFIEHICDSLPSYKKFNGAEAVIRKIVGNEKFCIEGSGLLFFHIDIAEFVGTSDFDVDAIVAQSLF